MKVSREQAAENRARVVEVAGRLFRENGFNGVGANYSSFVPSTCGAKKL